MFLQSCGSRSAEFAIFSSRSAEEEPVTLTVAGGGRES